MAEAETRARPRPSRFLGLWGAFLVFAFFAASQTDDGLEVQFRVPIDAFAPSELLLWLGACFLLLPGCTLLGVAYSARIGEGWSKFTDALERATPLERRMMIVVVGLVALVLARGENQGVLLGTPITFDEFGQELGGYLLARGHVRIPLPAWIGATPMDAWFMKGGQLASREYPGAIAIGALAEATRSGTLWAAVLSGITALCITAITVRCHGPRFGMLGGALALCSPAIALVSMTSHPHVASRAFLALGLAALLATRGRTFLNGACAGFALAAAASVRPLEIVPLILPLLVGAVLDAREDAAGRRVLFGMIAGAIPPTAAVVVYDLLANGSIAFTRLSTSDLPDQHRHLHRAALHPARWWSLFAGHVPSDLLGLAVFVAGPLGLPLVWIGRRFDTWHRRLFLGVVLAFSAGILRFAPTTHAVGPLHLADAAVPLVLLVCAGAKAALDSAERLGAEKRRMRGGIAGYVGLGLSTFVVFQAVALARHADVQQTIYRRIEAASPRPAVVLVPPYLDVVASLPIGASTGSLLVEWRPPRPDASEPVVILADRRSTRSDVLRWFPDRTIHVLLLDAVMGYEIVPLASRATMPFVPDATGAADSAARDAPHRQLLDPIGDEARRE